jgi:hypothetical protein
MHVYNAPAAMPKLTSKLTQNKVKNNLINANVTEYDKWVNNLQLNKNNEVWLNKGNDINYNYSAYNFNGIIYKESDRPKIFNNDNFNTTSNVINSSSNTFNVTSDDNNNDNINGNGSNIITKSSTTIGSGGGIHIILNTNKHVNFDEEMNITDEQQQQQQIGVLRLQSDSNDGNYSQSINDSELSPKSNKKSLSSNFLSYNDVDINYDIIDNDYTNEYNDVNSINNDNNSNNIIMLNTINNITSDYMCITNNISNNLLLNPLPTYMIISVSTYNQIIKADSILDNHNNHNYIKKVLSNIKLVELKMLITQTIIKGLEIAFHKQNQTHYLYKYYKYLHQQMKNDITNKIIEFNNYYNINLTFQCYYSYIPGWKIINDENDWFNAKHIVYNTFLNISKQQQHQQHDNNHQHNYDPNRSFLSYNSTTNSSNYHQQQQQYSNLPTIKLIYSLSHESELKLLEQIQKFYKYQKEQFLIQSNPHISLKSLTETLDNNISIKNNNYQNHNNNNNNKIGINSSTTTANTSTYHNIDNNSNINNYNKLKSKKTIITSLSSNTSSVSSGGATTSSSSMPSLSLYKNDHITSNDNDNNNNSDNNVSINKMKVKVILKKKSSSEVDNNYDNNNNIHNNDKTTTTTNIHINNYNLPLTATTLTNHENNNNNGNNTHNNNNSISNNNSNYITAATLPLVKISSTSNINNNQDNNIDHNNNNNHNLIFITKPKKTSIFYPPRKESLDQLYEKLEISLPKQYDYANNLEQKILKTKW